jgi:hypothetical protein
MARRTTLRASDADRERVAERLRHATAEGRLRPEELEERLGAVFAARTYGELDELVADLPAPGLDRPRRSSELGWVRPAVALAVGIPVAIVVLSLFMFVLTGVLTVWGLWLIVGWWVFGHRGRYHGGQRDRDHAGRRYVGSMHGSSHWHGCGRPHAQHWRSWI